MVDKKDCKNILVISGGNVDYKWAKEWLNTVDIDYVIAADSGLMHADRLNLHVNLLLGDYDSCDPDILKKYQNHTDTLTYPKEKDYTDTDIALQKAIEHHPEQIYMLGTTGTRYDHSMTNIFNLKQALQAGVNCFIMDRYNKIYLKDSSFTIEKEKQYGGFVSFLPLSSEVTISLIGMKYPLHQYHLEQGSSICQSNEIQDDYAKVEIQNGIVIVFETKDK